MIMWNKKKNLSLYQIIKCETRQFCSNTYMHGYKYITHNKSTVSSRFAWTFLIFLSLIISSYLLFASWEYNSQNPIETVADSVHNPIYNYQFPAITICNLNKISLRKLHNFIDKIEDTVNFDKSYIKTLISYLIKILYMQFNASYSKYYEDLQKLIDANNFTVQEIMMSIRPDCKELLSSCALKSRIWRCDSLFEETTSSEGLCCSSNYYALKDRSFSGYLSERYKTKPRRMSACGYQSGYKILINNEPDDYFLSDIPSYGVKILIHDSHNFPGWSAPREILSITEEAFISVIPELTYATQDLENTKIYDRNCLFAWERTLKYFKNYTHVNCLTECQIDIIKAKCNCIPLFFWPINSPNFKETNVCNILTTACIASLQEMLVSFMPGFKYHGKKKIDYKFAENQSICKCPPSCESTVYNIDTSKTIFSRKHAVNNMQFFNGINIKNHSIVSIYFKDLISIRYRKDINMNWYSELAWFGGLLGLFLGFSFTSGFEILYYITIRLCMNYYYYRKQLSNTKIKIQHVELNKKHQTVKVFSVYRTNDFYVRETVQPLQSLNKLKSTNNYWYID